MKVSLKSKNGTLVYFGRVLLSIAFTANFNAAQHFWQTLFGRLGKASYTVLSFQWTISEGLARSSIIGQTFEISFAVLAKSGRSCTQIKTAS